MSKLYIFGIGGTGSRVLRSLTMMLAAGVKLQQVDEVVPIIIDPDASNADLTRTVMLMNCYNSIRKNLTFADGNKNGFFRTSIQCAFPGYTLPVQGTSSQTLQQFIDVSSMDEQTRALIKMLFSDKNLQGGMNVGFKGNPNIGSVVLNQVVLSPAFQQFANGFAQGDKIFIISSIFGGTGASGFPLLLKTLRTSTTFPNAALINNAEIGAVTVLPYFSLKQGEIDSSTFISKTKSALTYYEHNICQGGQINALYYLGDDVTNSYNNNEGGNLQKNDAHLIEFLAASAIVDFCQKVHTGTVHKELGLREMQTPTVSFSTFYDVQHRHFFKPLTQFLMMANCLEFKRDIYEDKNFSANSFLGADIYTSSFMNQLRDLFAKYREWLKEMKGNKRSLDLYNLEDNGKPFDIVTGVKPKKIINMKSDYDLMTDRLNKKVKECKSKSKEDKLLEMFSLATAQLIKEKLTR